MGKHIVRCDKCEKDFDIRLKTTSMRRGIKRVYFRCPYCKEEYTAYYTDTKIRKRQAEMRRLAKKIAKEKDTDKRVKMQFEWEFMKAANKQDMDELAREIDG